VFRSFHRCAAKLVSSSAPVIAYNYDTRLAWSEKVVLTVKTNRACPPPATAYENCRLGSALLSGARIHCGVSFVSRQSYPAVLAPSYLITLSAWTRRCCGMTRPSCWEVLRLMKISNLDASFTGRSPGLAPFRISTTYSAARRYKTAKFAP